MASWAGELLKDGEDEMRAKPRRCFSLIRRYQAWRRWYMR
jgi:hypothetical protein